MNYDILQAYTERESNRLAEEDKAVQKKIADNAIAKVMGTGNQINTNLDNAVETAYRQNAKTAQGLKSETSQIGNQALTERLVRGLNQNRAQINTTLDNLKAGIRANQEANNVEIDRNYLLPQAERDLEIKLAQAEADKAAKEAQETAKAQEVFLEQLNEMSRQAGYDYDFDADIFALKQQGYTNKDWQVQYLQEAKRLQTRNAKKSTSSGTNENIDGGGGNPSLEETQRRNYNNIANGLSQYVNVADDINVRQKMADTILTANESGAISDTQAESLLDAFGLR